MSVLPRIALFLQYVLPRNSRNTQNLLAVCSPTDFTDLHRTFLLYVLPQISQIYTEPSCCIFSHGMHGIHRTFLLYILPQIAQIFTDAAFMVHLSQVHQPVLLLHFLLCWCTSCSVGALETSAPPERTYLCRSVKSVGEYFQQPLP